LPEDENSLVKTMELDLGFSNGYTASSRHMNG